MRASRGTVSERLRGRAPQLSSATGKTSLSKLARSQPAPRKPGCDSHCPATPEELPPLQTILQPALSKGRITTPLPSWPICQVLYVFKGDRHLHSSDSDLNYRIGYREAAPGLRSWVGAGAASWSKQHLQPQPEAGWLVWLVLGCSAAWSSTHPANMAFPGILGLEGM